MKLWASISRLISVIGEFTKSRLRVPIDLEWIIGWADFLWFIGGLLIVRGVGAWNRDLGWIFAGIECSVLAWWLGRAASEKESNGK